MTPIFKDKLVRGGVQKTADAGGKGRGQAKTLGSRQEGPSQKC